MESIQLTGAGKKDKRRELDYYPTPENVTIALMDFLDLKPSRIWEPACGNGAMSEVLKRYDHDVYSSDVRDTGYGSPYLDFTKHQGNSNFDAIITNPPFEKSLEFIETAHRKAPIVAMLLKSQYWHALSRYNTFISIRPAYVLPLTWRPDFLEHERKKGDKKGAPTMEVAWTVWIKGKHTTEYHPLLKPRT
jgi:hypothetical protein